MKINNLSTNVFVTILMFVMVVFMPMIDRMVCKAIGISPDDRMNKNPHADFYLHLRKAVLVLVFLIYLALLSYVVFFSRSASSDISFMSPSMKIWPMRYRSISASWVSSIPSLPMVWQPLWNMCGSTRSKTSIRSI